MKLLIEESVLRQALEAFDRQPYTMDKEVCESLRAMQSALDAAEKVEPVMEVLVDKDGYVDGSGWKLYGGMQPGWNKLYAAPTPPTNTDSYPIYCMGQYAGEGRVTGVNVGLPPGSFSKTNTDSELRALRDAIPHMQKINRDAQELREAARAVVEVFAWAESESIDRLRKALG